MIKRICFCSLCWLLGCNETSANFMQPNRNRIKPKSVVYHDSCSKMQCCHYAMVWYCKKLQLIQVYLPDFQKAPFRNQQVLLAFLTQEQDKTQATWELFLSEGLLCNKKLPSVYFYSIVHKEIGNQTCIWIALLHLSVWLFSRISLADNFVILRLT